ncbi:antibiotic biosynthesis monooxygenase family protein [Pseudomonas rustica]|uniref:antibiotic biosynthesis monooxygenase family protein n=1 Tax=Pseudomonas rustica TaxID=2827099 RepID=UPI003CE9B69D
MSNLAPKIKIRLFRAPCIYRCEELVMVIAASNTITIHAMPGKSDVVGAWLENIVSSLQETSGCLSYSAVQSHSEPDLWLVTAHWCTSQAMESHFRSPAQEKYSELMGLKVVRSLEFNCHSLIQ